MELLTPEEAKGLSGGALTEWEADLYLPAALEMAEEYLNRRLEYREDETEVFDGGQRVYLLRRYPVEQVHEFTVCGEDFEPEFWHLDAEHGVIRINRAALYGGMADVRIRYAGGWTKENAPAKLKIALSVLACALRDAAENGGEPVSANGERIGNYQAGYIQQGKSDAHGLRMIAPAAEALLRGYAGRMV